MSDGEANCEAASSMMSQQNVGRQEDNRSVNRVEERTPNKKSQSNEEAYGRHENRVERLIVISLALTLDKIKYRAGAESATEIINILHHKNFNLDLFKDMVNGTEECAQISQDVIDRCKEEPTRLSDASSRAPSRV